MLEKRSVSLRKLGEDRKTEVKFGRFLSNEKVTVNELVDDAANKTGNLAANHHVLALQDTTELNYHAHAGRTSGLGPTGDSDQMGLFLHPLLVLEAETGACLGLGDVHAWIRKEASQELSGEGSKKKKTSHDYQKLPIEEKESYRWLEVASRGKKALKKAKIITIIADRESDIYEEWYRIPDEKTHLLTRSCYNRRLANGTLLFDYVATLDVSGISEIDVKAREGKRSAHKAKLEIRFGEVEIRRPQGCSDKNAPEQIRLTVLDVKEMQESVCGEEEPIHWCLLTTHKISSFEDALTITRWYCQRWNIEQLFRTLKKQGFQIESSQIETGGSLMKLAIITLRAAVQTMQLTLGRDGSKVNRLADDVFTKEEITVLSAIQPRLEGKTQKQKNPHPLQSLPWAAWIIARMGGWKGYASEKPPGPITMFRGQIEFASVCRGWFLAKDVCIP